MTATDHRTRPRRRGRVLDEAIFRATLEELTAHGYARLTMERVAERARASKASLYRRWPTRIELVMDTTYHLLADPDAPTDTGTLRGDLLALFRAKAEFLAGPMGEALRGMISEAVRDPESAARVRAHSQGATRKAILEITRRAAERGEIDAAAVTPRRVEAGEALLRHHFLVGGAPVPDSVIVEIVDDVLLPLFGLV